MRQDRSLPMRFACGRMQGARAAGEAIKLPLPHSSFPAQSVRPSSAHPRRAIAGGRGPHQQAQLQAGRRTVGTVGAAPGDGMAQKRKIQTGWQAVGGWPNGLDDPSDIGQSRCKGIALLVVASNLINRRRWRGLASDLSGLGRGVTIRLRPPSSCPLIGQGRRHPQQPRPSTCSGRWGALRAPRPDCHDWRGCGSIGGGTVGTPHPGPPRPIVSREKNSGGLWPEIDRSWSVRAGVENGTSIECPPLFS